MLVGYGFNFKLILNETASFTEYVLLKDNYDTLQESLNANIQIYYNETLLYDGVIQTTQMLGECCTISGTNTIFDGYGLTIEHIQEDVTAILKFGNKQ